MESIAKTLIIITLVYYLIKGLIYLVLCRLLTKYRSVPWQKRRKGRGKRI